MTFSPIVKQVFVATAPQLAAFSMGGSLGYSCVLLQQLKSNDTTIHTDFDTLTWIASMHGSAGMGATLMPGIMQLKGRKYTFIGSCLLLLIGWILAFAATDALTVVLSAAFHGLATNCITIVNFVTVSEMLAPKYRSASMALLIVNQVIGQLMVPVLGTFINWKIIAVSMCGPVFIALVMVFIWPESPSWLAYKGKFEASERAFKWLRGSDDASIKELEALIAAQKESRRKLSKNTKLQEIFLKIKMKDFYLPSLHIFLILLNFYGSGGLAIFMYSRDIIELGIGGNSKIAVIGYCLTMGTSLIGCFISLLLLRYFNTKSVLSTALGCNICLICCSLVPYLQSIGVVQKDSLLFLYFYLAYTIFISSGFTAVTYTLATVLMPVKHRGIGGALFNIQTCLMFFVTVKSLPYIILYKSLSWTFALCALFSTICTILIWIYVPETKNRTLQEIEDYYNYGSFIKRRVLEDIELKMPIVNK